MANEEHLAILLHGVEVWNKWKGENKGLIPDLRGALLYSRDLRDANLSETNLSGVDLSGSNLSGSDLSGSDLSGARFYQSKLVGADLSGADLIGANLSGAQLHKSNLIGAILAMVDLQDADLSAADLRDASLIKTNLTATDLTATDFESAMCAYTSFSNLDLSLTKNLHLVQHQKPSSIGIDTIIKSKGKIPIEFLEGAGVPKHIIENMQSLVDIPTIQYYSCFISYSTKDDEFAHQLNDRMKREGLRVWFAPEEMKGGKTIHEQLYEGIRYHEKLILILSEASIRSNWVEREILEARKRELAENRQILFPIRLIDYEVLEKWELITAKGEDLAEKIRLYYIPDFSQWKNYDKFNAEFDKLLKALRAED